MKKAKEKNTTFFTSVIRKIKDFFYDISVKIHSKRRKTPKIGDKKTARRKELIFYFSIVILPLIQYFIFYICVNLNSILLAFKQYKVINGVPTWEIVWFDNFKLFIDNFFHGSDLVVYTKNSLTVYVFGLFIITPMSLIFSYYIYKKFVLSEFFRVILYLPAIISSVVTVFMYKYMVDVGLPAFGKLFDITIVEPLSNPDKLMKAILFFIFICGFGMNTIMYSSAMSRIPVSISEYAFLDGVPPIKEFINITVPLIFPTISTFLIVGIGNFFSNQAYLFEMFAKEAPMQTRTLGYYLFLLTYKGESEYPYASAGGIIFTLIAVPITLLVKRLLDKLDPNVAF